MANNNLYGALELFKQGSDASETFDRFVKYVKRAELVFVTADIDNDQKKKSLLQIWGGNDIMNLFEYTGKVEASHSFAEAIKMVKDGLQSTMNQVFPMYRLFHDMPQGNKKYLIVFNS